MAPATVMGGSDPAGGVAVVLLAVLAVFATAAAGTQLPVTGPAPLVTGPAHRGPHEVRPLRVNDPEAAGRGPRPRAPGAVRAAPTR